METKTILVFFCYLVRLTLCQKSKLNDTNNLSPTKRPLFSNIQFVAEEIKPEWEDRFRLKRGSSKIASIRALNAKAKDDEKKLKLMTPDETGKLKLSSRLNFSDEGDVNYEQNYNKQIDSLRVLRLNTLRDKQYVSDYNCDFENDCQWTWRKDIANGFYISSGGLSKNNGPPRDANDREFGSYLILKLPLKSSEAHVTSPLLGPTAPTCKLTFDVYQVNMDNGYIRVIGDKVVETFRRHLTNHTQWVVCSVHGNNDSKWHKEECSVGKITTNFSIILEVVPSENMSIPATVALDNLHLHECFVKNDDTCTQIQYRCNGTRDCINATSICDFNQDCPDGDDEDERQNCHLMPYGARCNFEDDDWCGWSNDGHSKLQWSRHNGSTPTNFTGPNFDHTYMNSTGSYLFVNMLQDKPFASQAILKSVIFNPPPSVHGNFSSRYYNTCAIRFHLHKTGKHKSAILIQVIEITPTENKTTKIFWSYMEDHGDQWIREVFILPNITNRYLMHFEVKKGYRFISDIAVDDISLSPECFGINIPKEDLNGYNYWNLKLDTGVQKETLLEFKNRTYFKLTTCNNVGRYGPTHQKCNEAYNNTGISVKVLHDAGTSGVQKWTVPFDGYYTFILAGASGGKGSSGMGSSRGARVRVVTELKRGQELFMLVGQEGSSACLKFMGQTNNCSSTPEKKSSSSVLRDILTIDIIDNGGGGGGATYLFMKNKTKHNIPLAIAAGGGGLGLSRIYDKDNFHGQGFKNVTPFSGLMIGTKSAGSGGGWTIPPSVLTQPPTMGGALLMGGIGGKACYASHEKGDGGFGGGGGGCTNGGGGGGYAGGNANATDGDGGVSYVNLMRTDFGRAEVGVNVGAGYVTIIPGIEGGCECDYWCVAMDEERGEATCVCPKQWEMGDNKKSCLPSALRPADPPYPQWFVFALIVTVLCLTLAFGAMCVVLYNRYQQSMSGFLSGKACPTSDMALRRLRNTSGSVTTQYNPNYDFGGTVTTIEDLRHIDRDQLRLVSALGQGAFGEVFQGNFRKRPGDAVEMPVAVKTLQEMSTKQAEDDFLTEALIMSKFDHPNIVHFIGVCFDKHPKFIVLELLSGGDLKNFLRSKRPKPERPSTITMKDLIAIAMDIARGCQYLEEKRFVHRDIAARNCLLTTKGPGRVGKIADFGMSRDIYRADYYRKDGKAMLPIKWMPPEAFLEGIFSSKTDVWSFGILLWEIMRMGFMPYTGCTNREVMDLVVQGGRLERPENCPGPIYGLMKTCWNPQPEDRPNFSTILERLGYCIQDPDVVNAPLPVFTLAMSSEADLTIVRPTNDNDSCCLQVHPNPPAHLMPDRTMKPHASLDLDPSSGEKLINETTFIVDDNGDDYLTRIELNSNNENVPDPNHLILDKSPKRNGAVSPITENGFMKNGTFGGLPNRDPEMGY